MGTVTKTPLFHALAAAFYILLVVSFMRYTAGGKPDDSFFMPLAVLSLLTLSAVVMGYLFLYYPCRLYFDNQREEAMMFFGKTVGIFGVVTLIFLLLATIKTK